MRSGELAVAVALDLAVGEPPASVHPVVGIGRLVDALERRLPAPDAPDAARVGGLLAIAGTVVVAGVARLVTVLPWPLRGVALWTLLSARMLHDEVAAVEDALACGGTAAGRQRVARLVSRDTTALDDAGVRSAAVSTLAENTVDAVTATLWWWTLGGLPAAAAHRFLDVLDSRWGHLDDDWSARGRVPARLDDAAAWVPARLTGLAWHPTGGTALRAEAARTPSPNGGWPMAAAALRGDVRLAKHGVYVLHDRGRAPDAAAVRGALARYRTVVGGAVLVTLAVAVAHDLADRRAGA